MIMRLLRKANRESILFQEDKVLPKYLSDDRPLSNISTTHGEPTNITEITRYTRDYLVYLHEYIGEVIEGGGDLQRAYGVDQSPNSHLDTFPELSRLNADMVFRATEFE
jgi:hypothetical protein